MSIVLPAELRRRWALAPPYNGYVGPAQPRQLVFVQRGYMQRKYDTDGHWTAEWTPKDELPRLLDGIESVNLEWSFDSNGIKTATIDLANAAMREVAGVGGNYHVLEEGWYSPLRAYQPPFRARPLGLDGKPIVKNEWDRVLGESAMVTVQQGYGDQTVQTFAGLIDNVNGSSKPKVLRLTARDMGQLLTDCHPFGWNIDPKLRDPVTFVDIGHLRRLEQSNSAANRDLAKHYRKAAVVIRDVTDIAVHACRWAGFPKGSLRIEKAGTSIKRTVAFARGEFFIDLIKKVQDATGFGFFIGLPTPTWPLGRPTLRKSRSMYPSPVPVEEVRDDQLLTDIQWQHTDEPLAGIIRVRGKDLPRSQGGRTLGGDKSTAVMAVYRPPWHRLERDARLIKHVVHTEPLYTTHHQCMVAARMIAVQEALAANTGQIELPGHPGLELDDVLGVTDRASGVNSRVIAATIQSTFSQSNQQRDWKQSIGVALLDAPDVVQSVDELGVEERRSDPDADVVPSVPVGGWA